MTTTNTERSRWLPWRPHHPLDTPQVREFLLYCAPALLVGFVLRALMTWQMPYGYMQFDSADFLLTANRFIAQHAFVVHTKRTFLVPLLYLLVFLGKVPALVVIPLAQHALGMAVILMTGVLTRLWVQPWRWIIVPLTVLMAANPNLLWFEHALMSESVYLFCIVALALVATLFTMRPTALHFGLLLVTLFLSAAARPEGRLLLGFGFLLIVLVGWGDWKLLGRRLAWLVGLACVTLPLTRTGQAGQLLYATVLPLAPDESAVEPVLGHEVIPIRDQLRAKGGVNTELQSLEQKLTDMAGAYLETKGAHRVDTNALCQRMAIEACLYQPWALPKLAARKFLLSTKGDVSVGFDEPRLSEKLNIGFNRKEMLATLSTGLAGHPLKDRSAVAEFVARHYRPLPWFPFLERSWRRLTLDFDWPEGRSGASQIPPWPAFFLLAMAGMVMAMAVPGPIRRFHLAWILSLSGLWFAVELTGVVNPRYRFVFEPFCLIYALLGLSLITLKIAAVGQIIAQAVRNSTAAVSPATRPFGQASSPRTFSGTQS